MKSAFCISGVLGIAAVLFLAGTTRADGINPNNIAGPLEAKEPKARPDQPGVKWNAYVVTEKINIYKQWNDPDPIPDPTVAARPSFGDIISIIEKKLSDKGDRCLIAVFKTEKEFNKYTLVNFYGWVDAEDLLDRQNPVSVQQARDYMRDNIKVGTGLFKELARMLPKAADERYANVLLKAITHPQRATVAFKKLVPLEDSEKPEIKATGSELQKFGFYYVIQIRTVGDNFYCLLSSAPAILVPAANEHSDAFVDMVLGWAEFRNLTLWTTREGFEYNLDAPAREARQKAGKPITLYSRQLGNDGTPDPNASVVVKENFAKEFWTRKMAPDANRYLILDTFPITWPSAAPDKSSGKCYKLCIPGEITKGVGGENVASVPIEGRSDTLDADKEKAISTLQAFKVFELVLVVDRTGSMQPAYGPLKDAVKMLVQRITKQEGDIKIAGGIGLKLRIAVVGFWDYPGWDSPKLVEDTGKFFEVTENEKDLKDLEDYIDGMDGKGGGDTPEEPFEGINTAIEKFLSTNSGKHTPGASRMIFLVGDAGNHHKQSDRPTRFDENDILKLINVFREEGKEAQKTSVALTTFNAVFTTMQASDKTDAGAKELWDTQMPIIAKATGGENFEEDFTATGVTVETHAQNLLNCLNKSVEIQRKQVKELQDAAMREGTHSAIDEKAAKMLEEIMSAEDWARIKKNMNQIVPVFVYGTNREPQDDQERLDTRILLTQPEASKLQNACANLADRIESELIKMKVGGADVEKQVKRAVITAMVAVMGEQSAGDTDPEHKKEAGVDKVEALMGLPMSEVQKRISVLPVRFGLLEREVKNAEEALNLAKDLRARSKTIQTVLDPSVRRLVRMGADAIIHVWMKPEELP